jgi:O-antigen/teichoic acid export membrane protein
MSLKKSLIKNTGFNLASYVYLLLASFFSISILLRNLGSDMFGVYLFLGSIVPLASVFDFGISNAVVRRLSLPNLKDSERIQTWKTSFSLFLIIGIVLSLLISAILIYLSNSLPLLENVNPLTLNLTILILTITVFINHINSHLLSLPQAEQRFDVFNSKTLLVGSANTILSAIFSGYYPDISLIFLLQLVFHILTLIFMARYSSRIFSGKNFLPKFYKNEGKILVGFGLKNFVGTLASQIEAQFSKYALGVMVSAQAITAFSIPQSIVAKGAGVVSQVAQAFFPLGTSLLEKQRVRKLRASVIAIQLLTFIGGILAIFLSFSVGKEFLMWWLKDAVVVEAAYPVLKILSIYFVLTALTPIPSVLLQSLNKPQIPSFFAVFTVVTEIILILILTPKYQVVGVAYGVLLASVITVPPFLFVTWRIFTKEMMAIERE